MCGWLLWPAGARGEEDHGEALRHEDSVQKESSPPTLEEPRQRGQREGRTEGLEVRLLLRFGYVYVLLDDESFINRYRRNKPGRPFLFWDITCCIYCKDIPDSTYCT